MAWSGITLSVNRLELRRTIDAMRDDAGIVVRCQCGAFRYCPISSALSDSEKFDMLHAGCAQRKGTVP